MTTFQIETTIEYDGELHLDKLPFHTGERVTVILVPAFETDVRQGEHETFMKGYAEEDSVYDSL